MVFTQAVQTVYEPVLFNLCEQTSTCNYYIETEQPHLLFTTAEAVSSWNATNITLDVYDNSGKLLMQ